MQNRDDISLAQWALISEFREGKINSLDLPRIAREDFGIGGVEFVNTLFEVPTQRYLDEMKKSLVEYRVEPVLIMVDDEGDGCSSTPRGRKQFVINHHKWIDIASYLGCAAIRTNCRGDENDHPSEALKYAAESYQMLLEVAEPSGINVLIENHGGFSNRADWMVDLFRAVKHPLFGSYPDWREPADDFDNQDYLVKVLPFAKGMSYRNQPTESLTAAMLQLCQEAGYQGWYGIESDGREAVHTGIGLLKKYLDITAAPAPIAFL